MAGTETETRQREAERQGQNTQIKKERVRDRERQRTKTSAFGVLCFSPWRSLPAMFGGPISESSWVDAGADSTVPVMFTVSPFIPELTSVSSMHYIKLSVHVVAARFQLCLQCLLSFQS